ncbi:DNA-binding IclR family transcriptional regulator [Skermanella aerolata]|uniref:Transcriptional regulator n=1 Tax=Skermanella aerolata TaxID=393310 RepID=A0A512E1F0_9PROT|nr:IclR family transcriptional regulator [Skermanella aerolata]KJB90367.1 IclR family transcriptional regulator [Skermanella aerolata KACC 11604]GEO42553.1 transcriptional regulator [Skermanella aerolata]
MTGDVDDLDSQMSVPVSDVETADQLESDEIKDRQFVVALARGLEVLRAFTPKDNILGNQDIAAITHLPKPTVSRLTHTLTRLGYLTYSERLGKYQLGTAVLSLGYAALANIGVRQIARPFMQELADYANASVSLGSRDRLNMVYVEHCRSDATVTLRLDLGSRIPVETTAMGRALLAALPASERQYLMDHAAKHDPKNWPRIKSGIEQAVEDYRKHGFVISAGEWQSDVHAVGVPLVPPDGSPILALNCGGPAFLFDRKRLTEDLGPRLVNLVRNVEAALMRR